MRDSSSQILTCSRTVNAQKAGLKRDPFILETSVPGIFAVGDVRQGVVRRVASAVGQGSTAISMVHQYLKTV